MARGRWREPRLGRPGGTAGTQGCRSMCQPREAARAVHAPFTCTQGGNAAGLCFPDLAVTRHCHRPSQQLQPPPETCERSMSSYRGCWRAAGLSGYFQKIWRTAEPGKQQGWEVFFSRWYREKNWASCLLHPDLATSLKEGCDFPVSVSPEPGCSGCFC